MGTVKYYIHRYYVYVIVGLCACLLIGYGLYSAGRSSAERDADIQRIQSAQQQLESTRTELEAATATNQSARDAVGDSVIVNERINDAVARSKESIERSESANRRSTDALAEAQRLISDTKRTAVESEHLVADSRAIIERAAERTARAEEGGEAK